MVTETTNTVNDRYSGDRFSGTRTPNDAILFTVSGITVMELFFENFEKDLFYVQK